MIAGIQNQLLHFQKVFEIQTLNFKAAHHTAFERVT